MDFKKFLQKLENSPHVRRLAMEIVLASEGLPIIASPHGPPDNGIQRNLIKCKTSSGERPRWKNRENSKYFEWDAMHEHFEVYDKKGRHVAVYDSNGNHIDKGKKGRHINVR